MLTLRPATPADAAAFSALAARLFRETFDGAFVAADFEAFLAASFTPARQTAEIVDPATSSWLAEADGELVGYFQLRNMELPALVVSRAGTALRLWRFYLDRRFHGDGNGLALLAGARREALARGADLLWLSVWEGNTRARRFYEKSGFEDVGESSFALGASVNRDRLLVLPLARPAVTIRHALPADAAALSALARRTFFETFHGDNNPDDLALYLSGAYTEDKQRSEILDPEWSTLVAHGGGELAAFAQLRSGAPPPAVTTDQPIEIYRFYVDRQWKGQGLAQRLMAACFEETRRRGAASVWLGVWEKNPRAIAFYAKCGFVDVGSHTFVVGTDPQTDRVMVRPLEPASS